MFAGAVLLTAGYFSLSRGVHPGVIFMVRSHADLLRGFAPTAAVVMSFLLVLGLVGGWFLAGRMLAPLTRKQFAVLEVLVAADGGVVSAEELLRRAWDQNADPFTNAVRITVSALRKRLGEPWIIATVAGVGYCIDTSPGTEERK